MSLAATIASPVTSLSTVWPDDQCFKFKKNLLSTPTGLKPQCMQFRPLGRRISMRHASRMKHASAICSSSPANHASLICGASRMKRASVICAALNATCAAEQTQTVTRQSSTITVAPIQGKEKSPELDDGGTGFPPRDDDGDGGGGGGGGGWSGGFFFFGFLAFLGFLNDQDDQKSYRDERRRR